MSLRPGTCASAVELTLADNPEGNATVSALYRLITVAQLPFEHNPAQAEFAPNLPGLATLISGTPLESMDELCRKARVSMGDLLGAVWQVLLWRSLEGVPPHAGLALDSSVPFLTFVGQSAGARLSCHAKNRGLLSEGQTEALIFDYIDVQSRGSSDRWPLGLAQGKLRLAAVRDGSHLQLKLEFRPDIYDRADLQRFFEQFQVLLESVLSDPLTPIGQLGLLSPAQAKRVTSEFNDTEAAYPREKCIHTLISEQARRCPMQIALVGQSEGLTYQELDAHSDRMAERLRALSVAPEQYVILFVDQSPGAVVALIAILKAGGVCVPLDANTSSEQLAPVLKQTQAPVLVTHSRWVKALPSFAGHTLLIDQVDLQEPEPVTTDQPAGVAPRPHNAACIVYEVNSPGLQGVLMTHQNIVGASCARALVYSEPIRNSLAAFPFGSASSLAAVFWTLLQAGTVVLPTRSLAADAVALLQQIRVREVSHLFIEPELYATLLRQSNEADLASVRTVILRSDNGVADCVGTQSQHFNPELHREYGPAEAAFWVTSGQCAASPRLGRLLGRPVPNAQVYVLDKHQQPVPIWVTGEIYVGGDGIGLGYVSQPDCTAKRFQLDLFGRRAEGRLFRTGDKGRWLPDGTLELLGRVSPESSTPESAGQIARPRHEPNRFKPSRVLPENLSPLELGLEDSEGYEEKLDPVHAPSPIQIAS